MAFLLCLPAYISHSFRSLHLFSSPSSPDQNTWYTHLVTLYSRCSCFFELGGPCDCSSDSDHKHQTRKRYRLQASCHGSQLISIHPCCPASNRRPSICFTSTTQRHIPKRKPRCYCPCSSVHSIRHSICTSKTGFRRLVSSQLFPQKIILTLI